MPEHHGYVAKRGPQNLKVFEETESAGTSNSYRCCNCRVCTNCLKASRIDEVSIHEEAEQDLIDKSVTVDIVKRCSTAALPFTADPDVRLATNEYTSLKIYNSQIRRLNKSESDLKDALAAEKKCRI